MGRTDVAGGQRMALKAGSLILDSRVYTGTTRSPNIYLDLAMRCLLLNRTAVMFDVPSGDALMAC